MSERPPLGAKLDRASASAAMAPTEQEVATFGRRSSFVGCDQRPGRPRLEPRVGRFPGQPDPRPIAEPEPEVEAGALSGTERETVLGTGGEQREEQAFAGTRTSPRGSGFPSAGSLLPVASGRPVPLRSGSGPS
jgi:hypothetical protein